MYHSVTFGDKNTWDDWHLVATSRPVIMPPGVKTKYVDIPGADGQTDYTQALTGETLYQTRIGSIEFYVMNGYQEWEYIYSEIMNYLHGQRMQLILEDDPGFYYEGRFSVNSWRSEKDRSKIVIDYDVFPYKIDMYDTSEDWLWDPFDFEVGIIREYNNLVVNGTITLDVVGSRKICIPVFDISMSALGASMTMSWSGTPNKNYELLSGKNKFPDIKIKNGSSTFTFKGNGIVTVIYRGGSL